MYQTCRISWQEVTRSDKYSVLSYVVFSFSSALYANGLRAQHHISGKTTFRTLCAPAHKVRESRPPGSVRGASSNGCPYRDRPEITRGIGVISGWTGAGQVLDLINLLSRRPRYRSSVAVVTSG